MGQASYGLRDWVKAVDDFTTMQEDFPDGKVGLGWLARAQQRLTESRTGNYDMGVLAPTFGRVVKHDVADFVGPVKIVDIPGKGRGLCAITDVPEGTLLLAAKAFALASSDKKTGLMCGNRMLLLIEVIRTFTNNPQRTTELYQLDSGEIPREPIPDGIVDINRINRICEINQVLVENEFREDKCLDPEKLPCGLWTLSAAINHSCVENAIRIFYGDVMMIRALRDLREGEEILINYVPKFRDPRDRADDLHVLPFTCRCPACQEESVVSEQQKRVRKTLYTKFWDMDPRWSSGVSLQKMVRDLESTYPGSAQYRQFLITPLLAVADAAMREGELELGMQTCRKLLMTQPRMPLSGELLTRFKITEIQMCIARNDEVKKRVSEMLDWILKRTGLKWAEIKGLAKDVIEAGDYQGIISDLLEAMSRK
jgi:hypothetical protein